MSNVCGLLVRVGLMMDRWERLIFGLVVCAAGVGVAADVVWL